MNKAYVVNLLDGFTNEGYNVNPSLSDYYQAAVKRALDNLDPAAAVLGRTSLPEVGISDHLIIQSAQQDDMAVVTLGRSNGEGLDRHAYDDFSLTRNETSMLERVSKAFHAQGKKVIVILNVSGATEMEPLKALADAVLCSWLPGQEGGNAIMDILSGRVNPSGKLSMSIPVSYFDTNTYDNFAYDYTGPVAMGKYPLPPRPERKNVHYTNYEEGIYVGYRYYDTKGVTTCYPFGYGLSYTTFSYSNPTVKATKDGFEATITVKNTGKVAGKESVQVYVSAPAGRLDKPAKELKAFAKTRQLKAGESQTLTFKVDAYSLASFDEQASAWETTAGNYRLHFANNVNDVRATAEFVQPRTETWKVNNVLKRIR